MNRTLGAIVICFTISIAFACGDDKDANDTCSKRVGTGCTPGDFCDDCGDTVYGCSAHGWFGLKVVRALVQTQAASKASA